MTGEFVNTVYGPIADTFAKSTLGDLCVSDCGVQTGPFGSQLHASDYVDDGTPIITVEHLGENRIIHNNLPRVTSKDKQRLAQYTLITGDIVFSRVGSVDRRAIVHPEEDGWLFSGRCLRVRPDRKKIDPGFLSWFFGLPTFQEHIRQIAVGATMPSLNTKILGDVSIYYPLSLKEQQAIASILGTLDDKIELNRKMNRTLEAMAQAIFKSWFVDFDPVRAKAAGRNPGLPKKIAALFPDSFEDSNIGEIPRGWEVVPLPEAIAVNPTRSLRKGEVAPYLDMANMPTQSHTPDVVIDRPFGSGMRFVNGDTLVARITPCLENGKTAYVDFLADGQVGWGSTEYIVLCPKPPLPEEFAYCLARSDGFREFAIQSMTGSSGRQRVPAGSLSHYLLVAPPEQLAKRFGPVVQPLFTRASAATHESRSLAKLRDTLLPKLISGELRVTTVEEAIDPANSNKANNYHKKQRLT